MALAPSQPAQSRRPRHVEKGAAHEPPPPSLARLLAARLCHDLGGAVATLAGTLELVEPGDPAMLELARETAQALRLRLYAAAV